jgi:hypoxanthine phosphoribosyltransferase
MAEEIKKSSNRGRRITVISAIVILILINAVQLYVRFSEKKEHKEEVELKDVEIARAMITLDSIGFELEHRLLVIDSLGGERDSLVLALEEIKELKEKEVRYWRSKKREMDDILEGYKELLVKKDEEIADLRVQNELLLGENLGLKEEKQQLKNTISSLDQEKGELEAQVEMASILKAENIVISALTNKGKEIASKRGTLRKKKIDQLKISFNIGENNVANIETKDVYLRIVEPGGGTLYDLAAGGGTIILEGKERFYTLKQDFLFDNKKPKLNYFYTKGSEWKLGKHDIELYCEGQKIGLTNIVIR